MTNRRRPRRTHRATDWYADPPSPPVTVCVWPKCDFPPEFRELDRSFPLCWSHAMQAAAILQIHRDRLALTERGRRAEQRRAAQTARLNPQQGWVYYLRVGDRIKIGHSTNIEQRLAAYPPDSTLLALHPGSRADEQALHREFSVLKRLGREWYAPHAAIDLRISEVVAKHGQPQRFLDELRDHAKARALIQGS